MGLTWGSPRSRPPQLWRAPSPLALCSGSAWTRVAAPPALPKTPISMHHQGFFSFPPKPQRAGAKARRPSGVCQPRDVTSYSLMSGRQAAGTASPLPAPNKYTAGTRGENPSKQKAKRSPLLARSGGMRPSWRERREPPAAALSIAAVAGAGWGGGERRASWASPAAETTRGDGRVGSGAA